MRMYFKRFLGLTIVMLLMMCMVSGCGNKNRTGNRNTTTQFSITTEDITEENTTQPIPASVTEPDTTNDSTGEGVVNDGNGLFVENPADGPTAEYEDPIGEADPSVDVDLTVLTSNMVYAEVYNMVTNPKDYLGKTIKIKGNYYPLFYEKTEKYYHYVLIKDALACCQNGMEFIWDDNAHAYPDEYPDDDQMVMITGTFSTYDELDYTYYYIAVDDITIVQ